MFILMLLLWCSILLAITIAVIYINNKIIGKMWESTGEALSQESKAKPSHLRLIRSTLELVREEEENMKSAQLKVATKLIEKIKTEVKDVKFSVGFGNNKLFVYYHDNEAFKDISLKLTEFENFKIEWKLIGEIVPA